MFCALPFTVLSLSFSAFHLPVKGRPLPPLGITLPVHCRFLQGPGHDRARGSAGAQPAVRAQGRRRGRGAEISIFVAVTASPECFYLGTL